VGGLLREHPIAGTVVGLGLTGAGLAATALLAGNPQLPADTQSEAE